MHICTQERNCHCIQKIVLNSICSQSCSILFCITSRYQSKSATINQSLISTLEKQLNCALKAWFHRQKLTHPQILRWTLVNYLVRCFLIARPLTVTYCHSIMNKKKPAFSSSALKLPTAIFCIHERTQKLFTQTISKSSLHEKGIIKRSVLQHNSFPRNYLSMWYSLAEKKYKQFFHTEYKKHPKKTQHGSIPLKNFKFN